MYKEYLNLKLDAKDSLQAYKQYMEDYHAGKESISSDEYVIKLQELHDKQVIAVKAFQDFQIAHKVEISQELLESYFGYQPFFEKIKKIKPSGMAVDLEIHEQKTQKEIENEIFGCIKQGREKFQNHEIDESTYVELLNAITIVKKEIYRVMGFVEVSSDKKDVGIVNTATKNIALFLLVVLAVVMIAWVYVAFIK